LKKPNSVHFWNHQARSAVADVAHLRLEAGDGVGVARFETPSLPPVASAKPTSGDEAPT
jgi:hypothetical protein